MKSQLLCTFTNKDNIDDTINEIKNAYDIVFSKIYVLQNEDNTKELICTYNVDEGADIDFNSVQNTISLHRKKNTNTLYTINALNEVIRELNGGVLDKRFPIPWNDYYNCLLLTNDNGLNKIPTKIHSIIDTKNFKEN